MEIHVGMKLFRCQSYSGAAGCGSSSDKDVGHVVCSINKSFVTLSRHHRSISQKFRVGYEIMEKVPNGHHDYDDLLQKLATGFKALLDHVQDLESQLSHAIKEV